MSSALISSLSNEFIIRVLASLPIDKSLTLRSVNKQWKELIECTLFWRYIDEVLLSFKSEWEKGVETARAEMLKLASHMKNTEPEDDQSEQIIKHLETYDIDAAGYEKDYLKYNVFPDGPVTEEDVPFTPKFSIDLANKESWKDRVTAIYKLKKSVIDRKRFFEKRPEIVLLINHPYKEQIGELGSVQQLTNLLGKMVDFFENERQTKAEYRGLKIVCTLLLFGVLADIHFGYYRNKTQNLF